MVLPVVLSFRDEVRALVSYCLPLSVTICRSLHQFVYQSQSGEKESVGLRKRRKWRRGLEFGTQVLLH
jgi:hypothetical protein